MRFRHLDLRSVGAAADVCGIRNPGAWLFPARFPIELAANFAGSGLIWNK